MKAGRLDRVRTHINRVPIKLASIDKAYDQFLADGTLPTDNTLAWEVLKRALHARRPVPKDPTTTRKLNQPYGDTREMLFREAACELAEARYLARLLLRGLVRAGYDPTDPEIIQHELEPDDFATISMQLVGWPELFVRPEYQHQLARVMQQKAAERTNRPRNDAEWDRGAGRALAAFLDHGVVPSEPRFFSLVLTTAEMFALHTNFFRGGCEELIAAFEAAANTPDADLDAALHHLGRVQARHTAEEKHAHS